MIKIYNTASRILIVLLFNTGCLSSFIDEPVHYVDPSLKYYYNLFLQDGLLRGHDYTYENIILELSHLKSNEGGVYFDRKNSVNHVVINENFYHSHYKDTALIKLVVYHELGHALLKKGHQHDDCQNIMYRHTSTCTIFKFRHDQKSMIDELFFRNAL